MPELDLPYFDKLLDALAKDPRSVDALSFHVHWGLYEPDEYEDHSVLRMLLASERLTRRLCEAAGVGDDQRILDVGCGFGGTVASIDGRFSGCDITGVNIDRRQLLRAQSTNTGSGNNSISWIEADACVLPVESNSVDTMLAVECIFHFPSRRTFLKEAARVLKSGGRLALSDFTIRPATYTKLVTWFLANGFEVGKFYGWSTPCISPRRYRALAAEARLDVVYDEDATEQTMPTYDCLGRFYAEQGWDDAVEENEVMREMAVRNFLNYRLLAFQRR